MGRTRADSTIGAELEGPAASRRSSFLARVGSELYVLIVAGVVTGAIVGGIGSRLAMFVLRVTSPDHVDGLTSDDGFEIGRFTLSGTYNLLIVGAAVGILGAAAYQWVRPWLIGPKWFRIATVAMAAGAVVGSMLVHSDGIDFRVLEPMWLAVALFVVLPAAFAAAVALAVDRVEARITNATWHWTRWILPVVLVAAFPPVLMVLAPAAVVLVVWVALRDLPAVRRFGDAVATGIVVRIAWFGIALLGLIALIGDIGDLRALA